MPVPIQETAQAMDLSSRFAATTTITGSPAAASETIVATLVLGTDVSIVSGIILHGWVAFTVGTSGTAATLKLRRTNVSGTTIATSGALTVSAGNLVAFAISGIDTSPAVTGQTYVLTLTITAGAAASTVSATQIDSVIV